VVNFESGPSGANAHRPNSASPAPIPPALFVSEADGVRATELTRGPWAHQVMHGGAICGLLGWAVEREQRRGGINQVCSRLTVEILSGMPMATYEVVATTVKAGKRTALVDAEVRRCGGFSLRRRLDGGAGPWPHVAAIGLSARGR